MKIRIFLPMYVYANGAVSLSRSWVHLSKLNCTDISLHVSITVVMGIQIDVIVTVKGQILVQQIVSSKELNFLQRFLFYYCRNKYIVYLTAT